MEEQAEKGDLKKKVFVLVMGAIILFFVFSMLISGLNIGQSKTDTFIVLNPSVDQICDLTEEYSKITPSTIVVEQWNLFQWETIDPIYYTTTQVNTTICRVNVSSVALYN